MVDPRHVYRKRYEHQLEAERSVEGFAGVRNIDKPGPTKVWVQEDAGMFYVYVELKGEADPEEVFAASGFERVT